MTLTPALIICTEYDDVHRSLKETIGTIDGLEARLVAASDVANQPDIDGVFLSVRAAEEFGATPVVHRTQLICVDSKTTRRLPPWVVSGVALAKNDPHEPIFEIAAIISAIVLTIEECRASAKPHPTRIAIWTGWLGFDRIRDYAAASRAIRDAYFNPIFD